VTLKAVPKPDGFDLRVARAIKEGSGSKWLPEDALFDAAESLKNEPPSAALIVAWYTRLPNGNLTLKYRCFHEHDRQNVALAADLLQDIQS
jgi:hypothetical protein